MPQKKLPTEPFPPPFVTVDGNSIFFGEDPVNLRCPKCNQQTTTSTETAPGLLGKNKSNLWSCTYLAYESDICKF